MIVFECPQCKNEFQSLDKRRKFCSRKCSNIHSNTGRILSEESKQKVSDSLKIRNKNNPQTKIDKEKQSIRIGKTTKGKYKNPENILELSKRTITKILLRLKIGCSQCGWNETICDIHHINGREINDPHNHNNLTYICPNCHRKCHNNLIPKENLINLNDYIGTKWKDFYYG